MQQGSIVQTGRKEGPDVWSFRWSEKNRNGRRVYRKRVIGTIQQYPDAQAARAATGALLAQVNADSSHNVACKTTVAQICEHFERKELRSGDCFRSFAMVKTYRGYIRKWVKPRWGSSYLDEINAEIRALVDHLALRERTLVLLAVSTGLRQSELFGLKWRDVDFRRGELSVVRSIVFGGVGRCKTESSQKPVPLHPLLGEALLNWRKTCKFTGCDDWIFASRLHKGRSPYWGACILRKHVQPVAESLKIQKRIGWHTFRHTYSTLLRSVGAEFKVMQELMRHSTLRTTMDVYTQAVAPAKHAAQAAVLALFFPMTCSVDDEVIVETA